MAPVTSFVRREDPAQRAGLLQSETEAARNPANLQDELLGRRIFRVSGVSAMAYTPDQDEQLRKAAWIEYLQRTGESEPTWTEGCRGRAAIMVASQRENAPLPLVRWQWVEVDGPIPVDAIPVGNEAKGQVLFAGRVYINGGVHIGK